MGRKKAAPEWQEGRHEFEVVLPADKTRSGRQETVRVGFNWKVMAGRPMASRDRTRKETQILCREAQTPCLRQSVHTTQQTCAPYAADRIGSIHIQQRNAGA